MAVIAVIAVFAAWLIAADQVHAAEGLELYTEASGLNVSAGDSLSFDLYASDTASSSEDLTLSIVSLPDDFSGYFKRDSYEVTKVHRTSSDEEALATFSLSVPSEASEGTYEVVLQAATDDGRTDTLTLQLNVTELESGESNFVVEYPEQEGVTGTSFTYTTTIANNTLTDQTYNFSSDAPDGWTVAFQSTDDSTQLSSIDVASGSSEGITITVTPPSKADAGEYTISCSASSAKESLSTDLSVTILGTYDLTVSTADETLSFDAYSNKEHEVTLTITNNGNMDLENVALSASAPTDWEVTFDESTIETLAAGDTEQVTMHVTPASDSLTGDYVMTVTADSDEETSTASFRVTVKTQTGWGIFAILIIVVVIAGLYGVIKKYGRR